MPFPGYLQDLSLLVEDSLIPLSGTDSKQSDFTLITMIASDNESTPPADLSASTWAELRSLTLDDKIETLTEENIDQKAGSVVEFTPDNSDVGHFTSTSWTPTRTPSLSLSPPPPPNINNLSLGQQDLVGLMMAIHDDSAMDDTPAEPLPPASSMAPSNEAAEISNSPPSVQASAPAVTLLPLAELEESSPHYPINGIADNHNAMLEKIASIDGFKIAQAPTTLVTRNTEEVIADLKRSGHHSLPPAKRPQGSQSDLRAEHPSELVATNLAELKIQELIKSDEDGENGDNGEESSSEDDVQRAHAPRKVTERKRRLNAVADNFMSERTLKSIKDGNKVRPEDESKQSAKWLVNQSENRQIISSPREYQVELFNRAKEKNIIAVLDTGSGKTLIAVLLLRHIFAQELEDRALGQQRRISFFLVDSVQLVFQQHAVLKANLDQPMNMFCGDMGLDLWSKGTWEKHIFENMVIVCTAEVLRHCLHHSFISMAQINLLIFDEAHHAKKDHAYARIIKDFYIPHLDKTALPKIFGMTASPVDARVDVRKAAKELEAILHSEIATAEDTSLVQNTATTTSELTARYAHLGPRVETPLYKQMRVRFQTNSVLSKPLDYSYEATRELGTWCADQIWPFCMGEEETKKLLAQTERKYHAKKVPEPLAVLEKRKSQLQEAKEIVKAHVFDAPDCTAMSLTSTNLSSKVMVLVRYLRERFQRTTDDKCIVFVKQRYTAQLLAKLLTQPNVGTPHLFVGTLVCLWLS